MITIIAGPRRVTDYPIVEAAIAASGFSITKVISGGAKGVDSLGEWWAIDHNIPYEVVNAQWNKYGRAAGPIRNKEMADMAEAAIVIWDGVSKGSKNMIETAKRNTLLLSVYHIED